MSAKEDWKFVQCFGEKTNTADLNNGIFLIISIS